MSQSLRAQLPLPAGAPTRLACALLVGGVLLGTDPAQAAAVAGPPVKTKSGKGITVGFTGLVKDSKGNPLPGVTVLIKGTKSGTSSGPDGTFHFNLPTGNETLIFSFIGFKSQEVAVNGRTTLEVALEDDNAALEEVVVVGYGTQTRATLTGAVAVVDMQKIQDLPVGSLSTALSGQLPGVGVAGGTGRPGDPGAITVRNPIILSKDGGTLRPLFVIDGVVRTEDDFNVLDQSEVESISVLKDAAAAIYGARGAQGVVLVATRRGQLGAPKFSYSGSVGVTDAVQLPKMMNAVQQATYLNDINRGNNVAPTNTAYYAPDELAYFANNNTDWLKTAWKPATVTRHALNMSGGTDRVTYFAGISYNYQNANFDNINANKWTYRASTDVKVARGLKVALSVSGDLSQKRMYYLKQGGENVENDMKGLLYTPQWVPTYVNGLPTLLTNANGANLNTVDAFHFFEVQNSDNYTSTRNTGLNVTASAEYELPFIKGLKARVLFGKTMDNGFGKQYGTKYNVYRLTMLGTNKHIYGGDVSGAPIVLNNGDRVRLNPTTFDSYQLNGYLSYDRQFGKHHVSAIALFEQSETMQDGVAAMAEGAIIAQDVPNLDYQNFATGAQTTTETASEAGTLSYAGRFNYDYDGKYLLETTLRYDASTNFAPEYRWGLFPSVSVGWVMSEERFFKDNVSFVNLLKLRASLGFLGGDATKPYNWQTSYGLKTGQGAVFGGNGDRSLVFAANNAMANRAARWDDDTKYNAGIDAQFLGNRLSLTVDGFYDHRYNMLTQLVNSAPLVIGAALPSENFSSVDGFGYEVSVGYGDKITKDLGFRVNTFFSWSDNKQVKVDVSRGQLGQWDDPTGRSTDMGVVGYDYQGMFRSQADIDAYFQANPGYDKTYTLFGTAPKPGMLYYRDIRGPKDASGNYTGPDGKITDVDQTFLTPKASNHYSIGFNPTISYKSLSISATMGMSWGGQDMVESGARKQGTATSNRPEFWADHWTPETPNAAYPAPAYGSTYDVNSAFWFRNSFSAGMRNANISYSLPASLTERVGVGSVRVFFTAINPVNFYNPYSYKTYSGAFDAYPTLRSLSLGLNVGF
ncbi:SusC/RagA family TonB-linked outer membrane protein [Hymenobacter ruricola]|uniref:SusC/RagA family TonB-linked outer membrane protein n=1 Tax=Hymenobacter ruricola TaxID=2791023 RepID=A0ABS0I381_9BACT|nr:SusC/RagA family TonB-linked outer membrane protein [Hymenobacter ruricola]MBF9221188.1 SusC/RagA family TonB-linked outer membrane protein [Hymenobacter ruricola]